MKMISSQDQGSNINTLSFWHVYVSRSQAELVNRMKESFLSDLKLQAYF